MSSHRLATGGKHLTCILSFHPYSRLRSQSSEGEAEPLRGAPGTATGQEQREEGEPSVSEQSECSQTRAHPPSDCCRITQLGGAGISKRNIEFLDKTDSSCGTRTLSTPSRRRTSVENKSGVLTQVIMETSTSVRGHENVCVPRSHSVLLASAADPAPSPRPFLHSTPSSLLQPFSSWQSCASGKGGSSLSLRVNANRLLPVVCPGTVTCHNAGQ